jgi:transcription elongation factor GreA
VFQNCFAFVALAQEQPKDRTYGHGQSHVSSRIAPLITRSSWPIDSSFGTHPAIPMRSASTISAGSGTGPSMISRTDCGAARPPANSAASCRLCVNSLSSRTTGDLRENGGYHAAKDEQGQIEARIITLQHILENARVGGPPRTDGVVGPGMTVTIRFFKDDDEVTFLLASREESSSPIDVYSPKSPLGAAIMGKKVGEKATYSLPNGRASTVEILEAVPYAGAERVAVPGPPPVRRLRDFRRSGGAG